MNKNKIKGLILDFIGENFGTQEREDPCYNVDLLSEYIVEHYDEAEPYVRTCNECGKEMHEGYCIENGIEYYCSDECLHKNISEEEYNNLYDNGNGDTYWTEWED